MEVKTISRRPVRFVSAIVSLVALASIHAGAQGAASSKRPDLSGSYERYRGVPVPPPAPTPPLKPEYLKEWQAKQQAAREADAKGEPLAAGVVQCLPEGMPGMMNGPFPMEILESKGQVTIIQEAYNQVRRIPLDQP